MYATTASALEVRVNIAFHRRHGVARARVCSENLSHLQGETSSAALPPPRAALCSRVGDGNEVCAQVLHAPRWREIPLRLGNVHVAAVRAVQLFERGPRLWIVQCALLYQFQQVQVLRAKVANFADEGRPGSSHLLHYSVVYARGAYILTPAD